MKTVYFVRHGQCQANLDKILVGTFIDSPLTELGRQQALAAAQQLEGLEVELIVSSPMLRTRDSARLIAGEIGYRGEIILEPLVIERTYGTAAGQPYDIAGPLLDTGQATGVETPEAVAERMLSALEMLKSVPATYILVVGHGGAEQILRTVYEGRPADTFLETPELENGAVREYSI